MIATAGTCRVCGCTDQRACSSGCGWTDEAHTLCSCCLEASDLAAKIVSLVQTFAGDARPPIPIQPVAWASLQFAQQQLLTMGVRAIFERVQETLLEELTEDALAALFEVRTLMQFLASHCPQEIRDEPVSDTIVRLLEPHVGARIILPRSARG